MKLREFLLFSAIVAWFGCDGARAQTAVALSFSTGSPVKIGFAGSRDVVLTASTAPAALQFTVTWSAQLQNVGFAAAAATTAAGKALSCGAIATNPDNTFSQTCIVAGINANAIGNGSIATMNFTAAKSSSPGTPATLSAINTTVQNVGGGTSTVPTPIAVDASANSIAASGGTGTVPFVAVADLNGDGKIDAADVQIASNQATGQAACSSADLNGDNRCDVQDEQAVIAAALAPVARLEIPLVYPDYALAQGVACVIEEREIPGALSLFWDPHASKVAITAFRQKRPAGVDWASPTNTAALIGFASSQPSDGCSLADWVDPERQIVLSGLFPLYELGEAARCCPTCPWTTEVMTPCPE